MKKAKKRPRGGSSFPCPVCGGITHVRTTRRRGGSAVVVRNRQCYDCEEVFNTIETEDRGTASEGEVRNTKARRSA